MEASYAKEPFDLRLLLLRLGRNLWKILALTILGTVLFGGGYYVKNVLLQPDPGYAASSTYKVEYVENPNAAGAYYINEATWNSLLHTGEFLAGVETHLQEAAERGETGAAAVLEQGRDRWIEALSAALPSDFSIPMTKATTQDPGESIALAHAAEETMCGEFAESMPEITRIKVLDHGDLAEAVVPDVRPVRAVILAAVLWGYLGSREQGSRRWRILNAAVFAGIAAVIFLLWELSRDGIWLPTTLRRRYGLHSLGTVESTGFAENVKYLLEKADAHKIAVCGALPEADPQETVDRLRELQPIDREWIAVPSPLLCPESAETLRAADVVLLAVPAGATVGKRLEAVLEYLTAQDCKVDGAFLWNADETLIRSYYFLPMIGSDTADNDMNTRNTEMEHTKTTQAEGEQA